MESENEKEEWNDRSWKQLMETCLKTHDYILRSVLNLKYDLERNRNHSLIRSISGRLKTMDSLSAKLQRLGYEVTVKDAAEVLHDIVGIRIVCSYLNDIYSAIERLQTLDRIQITEIKDYVAHPKPSGYRSVHVIGLCDITGENIQFEIQLRTTAMDSWAALEHQMRYKKDLPESIFVNQELYECAQMLFETDCRMQTIHSYLHDRRAAQNLEMEAAIEDEETETDIVTDGHLAADTDPVSSTSKA